MLAQPTLASLPPLNLSDNVTKLDHKLLRQYLKVLDRVLPVVPSANGVVTTKDGRDLFRFLMDSRGGGLTPQEAYGFVTIMSNLLVIVDAAQSQQTDFMLLHKQLQECLPSLGSAKRAEVERLLEDTGYIHLIPYP